MNPLDQILWILWRIAELGERIFGRWMGRIERRMYEREKARKRQHP